MYAKLSVRFALVLILILGVGCVGIRQRRADCANAG